MTTPLLIGIGIGLVTPYLCRAVIWIIRNKRENSVPISKERQEMMLKEDRQ